jgi:hypothetical protein
MEAHAQGHDVVHVFVQVGEKQVKVQFTSETATGLAIKQAAGGTTQDGLYRQVNGKNTEVADDEIIQLKNGLHFTLVPNGSVS